MKWVLLFISFSISLFTSEIQHPDEIQQILDEYISSKKTPGIGIAVFDNGKEEYYFAGNFSYKSQQPIDENTIFEIGSISKPITCILLQELINQNLFSLTDTLQQHVYESNKTPNYNGIQITLETLATHFSSLPYMPTNYEVSNLNNPFINYTQELLYDFLNNYQLKRKPGEKYEYSNLGIGLLGHIMELKMNKSYEELLIEILCKPLDMFDTKINITTEMKNRLAIGHAGSEEMSNWDLPTLEGAGAIKSSIKDMMKFLKANIYDGDTDLYKAIKLTHLPVRYINEEENFYMGMGWHIFKDFGNDLIWHNGGTGGYHSFIGFIPNKKKGIIILTNSKFNLESLGKHILEPRYEFCKDKSYEIVLDPVILDQYVGTYKHFTGLQCLLWRERNDLYAYIEGHPIVRLYPKNNKRFFLQIMDADVEFYFSKEKVQGVTVYLGAQSFNLNKID